MIMFVLFIGSLMGKIEPAHVRLLDDGRCVCDEWVADVHVSQGSDRRASSPRAGHGR